MGKVDHAGNRYRLILGLENQSGVDNTMPQRVMGYDYSSYEEQIKEIMDRNRKENRPAVTKRIHDDQKLAPVITLVLYYGSKEWERPRSLHDMLEFPEGMEERLKPYVADYPINLIQVTKLTEEERGRLTSDFRLIADYLSCGDSEERLERFMEQDSQRICHEEEFFEMLEEVAGDRDCREIRRLLKAEMNKGEMNTEEGIRMVNISTVYTRKGREEGIKEGIRALICDNRSNQVPRDVIVEKLVGFFSITREEAERYYDKAVLEGTEDRE